MLREHDTANEDDHLRFGVEKIISHENYDFYTDNFDFSMIKLDNEVDFTTNTNIRPICLPTNILETYAGKTATVAGWGTTSSSYYGEQASVLNDVDVEVLTNEACQ